MDDLSGVAGVGTRSRQVGIHARIATGSEDLRRASFRALFAGPESEGIRSLGGASPLPGQFQMEPRIGVK